MTKRVYRKRNKAPAKSKANQNQQANQQQSPPQQPPPATIQTTTQLPPLHHPSNHLNQPNHHQQFVNGHHQMNGVGGGGVNHQQQQLFNPHQINTNNNNNHHQHHLTNNYTNGHLPPQQQQQQHGYIGSGASVGPGGGHMGGNQLGHGPQPTQLIDGQQHCGGCKKPIKDRYMLNALNTVWHEDCLKCSCCECRLGEVGNKLFQKANLLLCQRDYLRLFGPTGKCSVCDKDIPGFEHVMKARGHIFHIDCFACSACRMRFCIGDRYYLNGGKILCEVDYNETKDKRPSSEGR